MPLTGHCLCKAVTYSVDVDQPAIVAYDHCDDCQRQSGSTYCTLTLTDLTIRFHSGKGSNQLTYDLSLIALVAVVPKDKLTVKGPTKSWAGKGTSGHAVHRVFCSECGSPIAHDPDAAPEIIAIKAGTLDSELKKTLKPVSGRGPVCSVTDVVRFG